MTRDSRVRRAHLLAGVIAGLIVGTAHALITHVGSSTTEAVPAAVSVLERVAASTDD